MPQGSDSLCVAHVTSIVRLRSRRCGLEALRRGRGRPNRQGNLTQLCRWRRRSGGEDGVVCVAKDERLRRPPNDRFQFDECAHLQPVPPQHHVLNEVPGEAPGTKWKPSITDRIEPELAQLVDEKIGAEEIVAPVVEEDADAPVVLLSATMVKRPWRADHQSSPRLEHPPAPRQPSVQVLGITY